MLLSSRCLPHTLSEHLCVTILVAFPFFHSFSLLPLTLCYLDAPCLFLQVRCYRFHLGYASLYIYIYIYMGMFLYLCSHHSILAFFIGPLLEIGIIHSFFAIKFTSAFLQTSWLYTLTDWETTRDSHMKDLRIATVTIKCDLWWTPDDAYSLPYGSLPSE